MRDEMNAMEPAAIELRVLQGPQAGSRLPLSPGHEYLLGSGDECEIVLAGGQIEAAHAALRADADGVHVRPVSGRVQIAGREIGGETTAGFAALIQIARVRLTVDHADSPWPGEEQIDAAAHSRDSAEGLLSDEDGDERDAQPDPAHGGASQPAPGSAAPARSHAGAHARGADPSRWSASGLAASALAVLCTCASALVLVLQGGASAGGAEVPAAAHEPARAQALTSTEPSIEPLQSVLGTSAQLRLVRGDDGQWRIVGRAASEGVLNQIRATAGALTPVVGVAVMLDRDRLAQAERFARARLEPGQEELRAELLPDGVVRITGAVANAQRLEALGARVKAELAAIEPVQLAVLQPAQLREIFRDRLGANDLARRIRIVREEPVLELEGVLTAAEIARWESFFIEFTRQHGSVLTVHAAVREVRDEIAASIQTVVGGSFPYLVTTQGQRVSPGGSLQGRMVAGVRDGEVLFADGTRVRVAQ